MGHNIIPVMGILGVFFVPGAVLIFLIWALYQRYCRREETVRVAIEKGLDPKEILPPERERDNRLVGLVFLLAGLALIPGLWAQAGWKIAIFGLVPAAAGAAYLIAWRLRQNGEAAGPAAAEGGAQPR